MMRKSCPRNQIHQELPCPKPRRTFGLCHSKSASTPGQRFAMSPDAGQISGAYHHETGQSDASAPAGSSRCRCRRLTAAARTRHDVTVRTDRRAMPNMTIASITPAQTLPRKWRAKRQNACVNTTDSPRQKRRGYRYAAAADGR
jgi:hypothetical protein